jgi:subtilisin family serine protease
MARPPPGLALGLGLALLAAALVGAASSPPARPPTRVAKTETHDPAFEDWWKRPAVAASGQQQKGPKLLVDASLQRRRDGLRELALEFGTPPRVTSADGASSPASPSSSSPSSSSSTLTQQALARAQWNLDRIDARFPPTLDRLYAFNASRQGAGVTIYTIDSGIIAEHVEFACAPGEGGGGGGGGGEGGGGSRCSRAEEGPAFLSPSEEGEEQQPRPPTSRDCDGHGTHVASTAAGRRVGVAKRARVVALRVLDCRGTGTIDDVIAALDWVRANAKKPAVVTMSLGVPSGPWSEPLEEAVRRVVVEAGVPAVVASGNSGVDACGVAPARVPEALTVAATDLRGSKFGPGVDRVSGAGGGGAAYFHAQGRRDGAGASPSSLRDTVYSYSNTGACVDLFAPGVEILAACGGVSRCGTVSPRAMAWATGTSMAVPHIAGAAAVFLGEHPDATPAMVRAALVGSATRGALSGDGVEDVVGGRARAGRTRGGDGGDGGGGGGGGEGLRSSSDAEDDGQDAGGVRRSTPDLTLYTRALAGEEGGR